jgi:hypothetical protein
MATRQETYVTSAPVPTIAAGTAMTEILTSLSLEQLRDLHWREEVLVRHGLTGEQARQVAESEADLHRAVDLIKAGCPYDLLWRIL